MLRGAVLMFGGALAAFGAVALFKGWFPPAFVFVFWGVLIVFGTLYERSRYKAIDQGAPGPGWTATPEKFIDEDSGATVTVYVDAAGERRYVRS
jgi:hypothetical protein